MYDDRTEKTIEELMQAIADDLIESRRIYSESILNESETDFVVDTIDSEMDDSEPAMGRDGTISRTSKRHRGKKALRRALSLVAILIMIMGLFLSVSEAARKYFYNAIFRKQGDHYVVEFIAIDNEVPKYKDFQVTYVPDGYKSAFRELSIIGDDGCATLYEEFETDDSSIRVEIVPREKLQLTIDNEYMVREEVIFHEIEAQFYSNGEHSLFMWTDGKYEYVIAGNITKEECISISEGIKGKSN